jgi:peptidoglycan/LPS O-acetylase OafA/YrhL
VFDLVALAAIALTVWQFALQLKHPIDSGYAWLGIPYGYPGFPLAIAAVLAATPSTVLVGRLLDNPLSVFIARISFGIYVWHYLIMELVRLYWDRDLVYAGHFMQSRFYVTALIVTGLSVAAGLLSFYLVERPAIRWARGLENRPGPAPISATAPAE